jgi:hypothetical protein
MIKDVAYNTGDPISGTTQVNDIAIATGNNPDYTEGSWVGGVDNSNAYVIVSDTTSAGLVGRTTGGGTGIAPANTPTFWKSAALTDQALLNLVNKLPGLAGNYANVTAARAALAVSPFAIVNDYTGGGTSGTSGTSGTGGGAGWLFYSDEGELNAPPPEADGNVIFRINSSPVVETYNPNKTNGVNEIYFNLNDSAGTDYTTQFTALTSGGTISITQGANTATYTSAIAGTFFVDTNFGFFLIQTGPATQTVTSDSPFVSGVPITLSFS